MEMHKAEMEWTSIEKSAKRPLSTARADDTEMVVF